MANAYFSGVQTGFFVGSLNTFGTLQTYNNDMGFILEIDPSRNCIDLGTTVVNKNVGPLSYDFEDLRSAGLTNI